MNPRVGVQPLRVVGRYAMYREIASGGMAAVHIGRLVGPVGFARTVAIKRLHPQFAKDPEFVGMFLDEARLVSRIRHPNVVQTLDIVSLEGELFLVMDFVHGESLSRLTKATAALGAKVPTRIIAAVMTSVLHGLHAAHEAKDTSGGSLGIVHRDVSPHNIMVGTDGVARVLDFGVAYAAGRVQSTREGQIKGKIAYMSPEQLNGDPVDRLTDVYAASVVLWELVAGRRLFDADNQGQILNRVLTGKIDPPSKYTPQMVPAVEEVIMRGLARNPSERWASAREMAAALERAAGVATPSMVGGWVESVVGEALGERAAQLALIEQTSLTEDDLTPSHSSLQLPVETSDVRRTSLGPTSNRPSTQSLRVSGGVAVEPRISEVPDVPPFMAKRSHVLLAIVSSCAVGVALGAALLAGATTTKGSHEHENDVHAAASVASDSLPPARMEVMPETAMAPKPPTTGIAAATASAPPIVAAPIARAPLPKAAAPKVDACTPPYTFDAAGHKKYKLECL